MNRNDRIFSLASLTVLELSPPEMVEVAAQAGENAGRENGAVLVDAFHFYRSGSRLEDLARVAPSRLRYAQVCDVAGPRPTDMAEVLRPGADGVE